MVTTPIGSGNAPPVTVGEALDSAYGMLCAADLTYGHGTDNPWDEAVHLVLCACDLPLDAGDEVRSNPLDPVQLARIRDWLQARVERRVPLAYLTGRAWFAGLEFRCDPRALVPRSPLAEVIADDYAPWWCGEDPATLLDLCCGGGAIGLAAAVYRPGLRVTLADLDADALALARENVAVHGLDDRVETVRSDLFEALESRCYDLILSNPPYVDARDLEAMPAEYHAEPAQGLGSGVDGLDHARRILTAAAAHLTERGLLFLELGNSWEALDRLLPGHPLTWLEFRGGGHGVLVAQAAELPALAAALELAGTGAAADPDGSTPP